MLKSHYRLFISLVGEFWKALLNWDLGAMAAVHILSQQLEFLYLPFPYSIYSDSIRTVLLQR